MSQTRKPRQHRAEPRRPTTRDAALGSLTLGALWALAAQGDQHSGPAETDHAEAGPARLAQVGAAMPPQAMAQAGAVATAPSEVNQLHRALHELIAGMTEELTRAPAPTRAPMPDGTAVAQPSDDQPAGANGADGTALAQVAALLPPQPLTETPAAGSAGAMLDPALAGPGVVADAPADGAGSAAAGSGDVIVVEAAAPAAVAAGGLSTPMLLGAVAGVSALIGLAGKGLTNQAPAAPTPSAPPPPPAPAAPATVDFDARVVDGYVKGATVFYDADADGVLDAGEVSTVTDENGNFSLDGVTPSANGRIVVLEGGTDIETGNKVGRLMASGDPTVKVVSPLTLVLALNPELSEAELKTALGLPQSVDIDTFDPVAAMDAGSAEEAAIGQAVFSAQQQLLAVVQAVAVAVGGGEADTAALTKAVASMGSALKTSAAAVDPVTPSSLGDRLADIVGDTLENAGVSAASRTGLASVVAASAQKVAEAYESAPDGLALWQARRLVATPDTASEADRQAAIDKLASAKAAASASQVLLLDTVAGVASGATDADTAADTFGNTLSNSITELKDEYSDLVAVDAGQSLTVDNLPAFLVADLPGSSDTSAKAVLDYATAVESVSLADLVARNVRVVKLVGAGKSLSLDLGSLQAFEGQDLSADLFADGDIVAGAAGPDYAVTLRVANAAELEAVVAHAQDLVNAGIDKLALTQAGLALTTAQADTVGDAGLQVEGLDTSTRIRVTFEVDDTSGYTLGNPTGQLDYDFGGAGSSIAAEAPEGAAGRAAQVVKSQGAEVWAGTTFLTLPTGELATPDKPLVTMRVWTPEAGTKVLLKLEALDNPPGRPSFAEVEATTTAAQTWQTLSFDFSAANHALSLAKASVFFDYGKAGTGKTFYFDSVSFLNVASGEPPPPPELTDLQLFSSTAASEDFATQFTGVETFGNGATFNFQTAVDPNNVYARVGSVVSGEGYGADINVAFAAFTAVGAGFAEGYEAFSIKVAGTPNGRLEVKLIGAGPNQDSVANIELATYAGSTDLGNGWFDVAIPLADFTNPTNIANHSGYLIGMPGDNGATPFTFYFTDIELLTDVPTPPPEPTNPINVTFESHDNSGYTLGKPPGEPDSDFGGAGSSIAATAPATSSGRVAQVVKADQAQTSAGTTFLTLDAGDGELVTTEHPLVTMRVWSPEAGTKVLLKLETLDNPPEGGTKFVEVEAFTTAAKSWQTLSFDFSNADHDLSLAKASVFFDFGQTGTGQTFYFDNVSFLNRADALATPTALAFSDEFGGFVHNATGAPSAPATHWTRETGTGNNGWGNGESQVYTSDLSNAFVEDGTLHIVANKTGTSITSARLKSDLPDLDPYGYIEVRAKLPAETGAWPAIWMLGNGTWPDTGEIDIVEWARMFADNQAQAAIHFKGDNNQSITSYGNTAFKASTTLSTDIDSFHTYQLWWSPDAIRVGVDGDVTTAYFEYLKPAGATASWWPYDHPMDLILNVAVGGSMGGTVPAGDFTYTMEVDYVRVFQQGSIFDVGDLLSAVETGTNGALLQSVSGASIARTTIDLAGVREAVDEAGITDIAGVDTLLTAASTGVMARLSGAGMDQVDLDDALVDALAGAGIDLGGSFTGDALQTIARADGTGSISWIQASVLDLIEVGIDRVLLPATTDEAVLALRDDADTTTIVDLTGLPFFVRNADQAVALAVDDDDVVALLADATSLQALAAQGVTALRPDGSVTSTHIEDLTHASASTPLQVRSAADLTSEQAELLGLGTTPGDPFGPFMLQPV